MEKHEALPSHAMQALQAHNSGKEGNRQSNQVPTRTEDIKSLNQLLQWATANSVDNNEGNTDNNTNTTSVTTISTTPSAAKPSHNDSQQARPKRTTAELQQDCEWLDAAFPDMYAGIRELIKQLEENKQLSQDDRVGILEDLQEFFVDLNYAVNIDKIGALQPILALASNSEDARERATAIWILGTCMQHLDEVKQLFLSHDVHSIIAQALQQPQPDIVRGKAVMASAALLHHPSPQIVDAFQSVQGYNLLIACLADRNKQTRRRAQFFLQHARHTGNQLFVDMLMHDQNAIAALSASYNHLDIDDFVEVETAMNALAVVVESNAQALLQVAPELPGILDNLVSRCADDELGQLIRDVADRLS